MLWQYKIEKQKEKETKQAVETFPTLVKENEPLWNRVP
jgi:hypothetical protein